MQKMDSMEKNGLHDSVCDSINSMKSMADLLIPNTYPKVSFLEEQQVLCLKQRTIIIDGYDVLVCFSRADYEKYILETVQIQSPYVPFLPFNLICKIGKLFLGKENLGYVDFFRYNRKVYCWVCKVNDGVCVPTNLNLAITSYEGFEFSLLDPSTVDLF